MISVLKYQFQVADEIRIKMPMGAEFLHFGVQEKLTIWVLARTENKLQEQTFYLYGTGQGIEGIEFKKYLRTVQDGRFVWHLFGMECQDEPRTPQTPGPFILH